MGFTETIFGIYTMKRSYGFVSIYAIEEDSVKLEYDIQEIVTLFVVKASILLLIVVNKYAKNDSVYFTEELKG